MDRQLTILTVICSQLHRLTVSDLLLLIQAAVAETQSRIFIPPTPAPVEHEFSSEIDSDLEADLQL